ncbi:MAG: hypothetical protein GY739_05265 [Mesoflavibacter sp.]|nr:hypothetical protein [Mesoflavibacter sp.]
MNKRIEQGEDYSRGQNIRIHNIPAKKTGETIEDQKEILKKIYEKMEFETDEIDKLNSDYLDVVHRVDRDRALLVRYVAKKFQKKVLSRKSKLDGSFKLGGNDKAVSVNIDLCQGSYQLQKRTKEEARKLNLSGTRARILRPGILDVEGRRLFVE